MHFVVTGMSSCEYKNEWDLLYMPYKNNYHEDRLTNHYNPQNHALWTMIEADLAALQSSSLHASEVMATTVMDNIIHATVEAVETLATYLSCP